MVSQFKQFHYIGFGSDVMNNKQDVAAVYAPCWMYCEHLFQIFSFFFPPYLKNCTLSDKDLQM